MNLYHHTGEKEELHYYVIKTNDCGFLFFFTKIETFSYISNVQKKFSYISNVHKYFIFL